MLNPDYVSDIEGMSSISLSSCAMFKPYRLDGMGRTFKHTSIYLFADETDLELRYSSEGDKMNATFEIEFYILHNSYNREIKIRICKGFDFE